MTTSKTKVMILAMAVAAGASARAEDGGWQVMVAPYVWGASINGEVGIGDIRADVDLPISDVLDKLDMAGMLNVEVRKSRWGLLADGVYMKISDDTGTPGPFFNTIDTTIEMGALDLALAYRLVEGERGWVDLLLGARYVNVSGALDMNPDTEAVDEISGAVMDQTVASVHGKVEDNVDGKAAEIAQDLAVLKDNVGDAARDMVRENVGGGVGEDVGNILDRIDNSLPGKGTDLSLGDGRGTIGDAIRNEIGDKVPDRLDDVGEAIRDAIADAVKQRIDARIEEIKGNAQAIEAEIHKAAEEALGDLRANASDEVKRALDEAEQQLAGTIEDGMQKAAGADVAEERDWVDPYVGVRGRLNLTQRTFLGARGDIGGFGVGSDLTWQLFGGVGYQVSRNVELEAGWRHLDIDYDKDGLLLDIALSGAVAGVRVML